MALSSSNVRVAVTGALSIGTAEAAAPTTGDSALGAGWADLGYFNEDGVTETRERSTEKIKGWQNADTVREVVTEATLAFSGILIETKKETVELYYGNTVDSSDGSIVVIPAKTGGRRKFVLDVVDGDDFIRAYIASGEVTEVGEQVFASGEPIGYEVTITAYPDDSITDPITSDVGCAVKWYSTLVVAATTTTTTV